jgi:hypothetical protein
VLISVIVLGFVASLDPLRPVVFLLVLRTQFVNAIAFLAGWTLALSVLFGIVVLLFAGDTSTGPGTRQRTAASVVELAVGGALIIVAARRWRGRHDESVRRGYPKAVRRRLDDVDVRRSAVVGVLIQPRALTTAAAVVVARDRSGALSLLIGFVVYACVSTAALLGILIYDIWRPESARLRFTDAVSALEWHGPMIFTVLSAAGGSYLVVDGLRDLLW